MARWTFTDAVGNWSRDRRGNFAILTGVTISMLAMGVGFGVNTAQMMNTRSALLSALDAAVTSTARDLTTGLIEEEDAEEMVTAFLLANVGDGFATGDRVQLEDLEIDRTANTVSAGAVAVIDLAFPLFSTGQTQEVRVESAAVYSDRKIEVAMMLDVTGSMAGWKIEDLKNAATSAVETLLDGNRRGSERVRVALVPYAEAVNVGEMADIAVFREQQGKSELPPYEGASRAYVRANTSSHTDDCASERKLPDLSPDFSDDGPDERRRDLQGRWYKAKVNRDDRVESCPAAEVVPLTSDEDELIDVIENFSAQGVTAGNIGIQWTRYMLSPKWRETIRDARLGKGPAAHDPDEVAKFAILMTDGQFNTAFAGSEREKPQQQEGRLSRRSAEALCSAMKEDGIEVFTIGFDLNNRSMSAQERRDAKAVLRNCASEDTGAIQHYFEASTGTELDAAFQEIIRNTESLYLTM